jgi:hypothetical protein
MDLYQQLHDPPLSLRPPLSASLSVDEVIYNPPEKKWSLPLFRTFAKDDGAMSSPPTASATTASAVAASLSLVRIGQDLRAPTAM